MKLLLDAVLVVGGACLLSSTAAASAAESPLLLIPGFAASVFEVQYNTTMTPPHVWCSKSSHGHWERVWGPSAVELVPKIKDCWWYKIKVYYETNTTDQQAVTAAAHNAPGVQWRVKEGVEGLQVEGTQSNVYRQLFRAFPNTAVLTYDFRLSPTGNPTILQQIQTMIEATYWNSHATPVTLISHSMGALLVHTFLTQTATTPWKAQYLHAWIPLAPRPMEV